jgi:predicted alpha/beta superfamily hydrolase
MMKHVLGIAGVLAALFQPIPALAVQLTVTVKAPPSTPPKSILYLTGTSGTLCEWKPQCLPLKRVSPGIYQARFSAPEGQELQFKVTRGSWETEAATATGARPPNFSAVVPHSDVDWVYPVVNWADLPPLGVTGTLLIWDHFRSPELGNERTVRIWLPSDYFTATSRRYPVIYAHDGQNLFDPSRSNTGVDWGIDEQMSLRPVSSQAIVVGVDSTQDRFAEYDWLQRGELYGRFILETLKPRIDATFRTLPERESTWLMGSSMGGLISVQLLWKHPESFSRAAALSLPVWIHDDAIDRVIDSSPKPDLPFDIYMDHGTLGGDAKYEVYAKPFYEKLLKLGVSESRLLYRVFPYAEHTEADWARRVAIPIDWLLTGAEGDSGRR